MLVMPHKKVIDNITTVLDSRTGRVEDVDWPLKREIREIVARRKQFDPEDRNAISISDTSLQTMFFDRMISGIWSFFASSGCHAALEASA